MSECSSLSFSALQKAFRKKDIKVNGVRVKPDYIVMPGDKVEIFITDTVLDGVSNTYEDTFIKGYSIVYEDENIIIVNKKPGISVHQDKTQAANTLIDNIRKYLNTSNAFFQPSLCHRLDRNTGGLVIIAKNQESLDYMLEKMETREIKKYYQCLVKGKMENKEALLKGWLFKDESKSRVFVSNNKTVGAMEIQTKYKVISYNGKLDISHLEIELLTGRTHQIRAHLAFIGHPIIGDGKYGSNAVNRPLGAKIQELWACRLEFNFHENGKLGYLNGNIFKISPEFNLQCVQAH